MAAAAAADASAGVLANAFTAGASAGVPRAMGPGPTPGIPHTAVFARRHCWGIPTGGVLAAFAGARRYVVEQNAADTDAGRLSDVELLNPRLALRQRAGLEKQKLVDAAVRVEQHGLDRQAVDGDRHGIGEDEAQAASLVDSLEPVQLDGDPRGCRGHSLGGGRRGI